MLRFYALICLVVCSLHLSAAEIAGVKFPDTAVVGGQSLVLNGVGLRYRMVVKVYAAALYLPQKSQSDTEAITMLGSKRIHGVMFRELEGNVLGRLLVQGIKDNSSEAEVLRHINSISLLGRAFSEHTKIKAGDSFSIDFVASQGPQLKFNGVPTNTQINDPSFNAILLRIWLGKHPVDHLLKQGLLSQPFTGATQ
jgi:hypothetical protein